MSPRRLAIGVAALGVLAWLAWRAYEPATKAPPPESAADSAGTGFRSVRLYFAAPDGESLVSETRELPETEDLRERVAYLVSELDQGPRHRGVRTLPEKTGVLHVYLDDRGLMTVDLSASFRQSFRGGSTPEYLAIASLVRTLGANLPEVRRVMLVCGGRPISTLGGHVPLDRPFEVSDLR